MNTSAAKEKTKTYKQMKRPVLILNLGIGLKTNILPVKRQNRGHYISGTFTIQNITAPPMQNPSH